ncbi:hypothetical protein [uncultured Polaribacter sp.]|uniref:hypothetical protein n=1 Tax=uncultured Polaribacter sp. TaxID=174711 RepID=UPI0026145A3B|nr:hypothetical protein [uncultured Polaribacter sp.]
MKKLSKILLITILLAFNSCQNQDEDLIINGEIENSSKKVILENLIDFKGLKVNHRFSEPPKKSKKRVKQKTALSPQKIEMFDDDVFFEDDVLEDDWDNQIVLNISLLPIEDYKLQDHVKLINVVNSILPNFPFNNNGGLNMISQI